MGVNTTNIPVIKPDLEAEVYSSPIVWVAKLANKSNPNIQPLRAAGLSIFSRVDKQNGMKRAAAIPKRRAIKVRGETSVRLLLTVTKVPPQISVQARRKSSALVLGFIKSIL